MLHGETGYFATLLHLPDSITYALWDSLSAFFNFGHIRRCHPSQTPCFRAENFFQKISFGIFFPASHQNLHTGRSPFLPFVPYMNLSYLFSSFCLSGCYNKKGQNQRFALQELLRNSRWLRSTLRAFSYTLKKYFYKKFDAMQDTA